MKNRLYLVGGVLLVAALGGLVCWSPWQPREPPEPVYEWEPLSYWLSSTGATWLSGDIGVATVVPSDFLVHGSNSVPYFVRALKRDSWIGAAMYRKQVWPKLPPGIRKHLTSPADNRVLRENASECLGLMGSKARPAIPALIRALKEDDDQTVRINAAWALAHAGKGDSAVTAALTEVSKDKDANIRKTATYALRLLDAEH